ncbi:DUF4367 domain-containing protein [Metabacillus litoralis]|uniref:DUF4367 domain-containing protein n=1 Tax=Metabacillus litoralis TaxID=152268 RepID=A0A179SUA1_9BACI|nr:DUF4367 domain-containing protein [Metabacillus litoralis]OAS85386.1 hypothetical protein A6K24_24450 [Metabacillus litoralis]
MKKLIATIFILLLTACSGNSPVEELKQDFPKIKEVAESLPQNVREKLAAPTELPFEPKYVSLNYAGNPPEEPKGDIVHTDFTYSDDKGVNLQVITFHKKKTSFSDNNKQFDTVELKNGIKALIEIDSEEIKQIRWKKDGLYYSILLAKSPESEEKYTIKELVKIANSMEYVNK